MTDKQKEKAKKGKILVIEDDAMIMDMYSVRLQEAGYEVIGAVDGGQGLAMAKEQKPNVILLDIILPKLDGFSVLKSLKAEAKTKKIPVIILTNLGQESDIKKGTDMGAVDYMVKASITPSEIIDKLDQFSGK